MRSRHCRPQTLKIVRRFCGVGVAFAVHSADPVRALVIFLLVLAVVPPTRALAIATATPAEPMPFRKHMLLTDRIKTGHRAFARLLLGGRVVVLAREGSALSITEVPGATTIEVESGRVAITVDRQNLHPEDLIEVRTPHAVVTVPDETLVVDVADGGSTFKPSGLRIEVFPLDRGTGAVVEPPTAVAAEEVVTVAPSTVTDVVATR